MIIHSSEVVDGHTLKLVMTHEGVRFTATLSLQQLTFEKEWEIDARNVLGVVVKKRLPIETTTGRAIFAITEMGPINETNTKDR